MLLYTNEEDSDSLGKNENKSEETNLDSPSKQLHPEDAASKKLAEEGNQGHDSSSDVILLNIDSEIIKESKLNENKFNNEQKENSHAESSLNSNNRIEVKVDSSEEASDEVKSDKAEIFDIIQASDNLKHLLQQLTITENTLTHAGINLTSLEYALNPGFYGRITHFIITTPILLSLLRWPLLQRSAIAIPKDELPKKRISLLMSAAEEGKYVADLDIQQNPREHTLFLTEDSPLVRNFPQEKETKGKQIIFTSRGLLLGSSIRLKAVLINNAFYEAAEETFIGVWSALVSSLIIQGTFNYYYYPDERGNSTVWDALGFSALLNIICIKSLDLFCVHAERQYEVALASALNEIYIWPFIAGIPLLLGTMNGLYAWRQANILRR